MKIRLSTLRTLIKESLDDQSKTEFLKGIAESSRPYLKGQWQETKREPGHRTHGVQSWTAQDPHLGTVYLNFSSLTSYGRSSGNSRLRDPSRTHYSWSAYLSLNPWSTMSWENAKLFSISTTGEGREQDKREAVRKRMWKSFGVDPYKYLGDIEPKKEVPQDQSVKPEVSSQASSEKLYKIYGRLKSAPAHTRLKGKAFLAKTDTKFKSGEQANVAPENDKLRVKKVDSDHSQLWDPE